jgi:hypothetical protein
MPDPILDEIRRVRVELIKQYGGWKEYFRYVQKLDRAHRLYGQKQKRKKAGRQPSSTTRQRS